VNAAKIPRLYDITAGGGVDVRVWRDLSVGIEWRWFIPDPIGIIPKYDGFAVPAYEEALRGGQLWLNTSYSW
jgi:hypothetical protein